MLKSAWPALAEQVFDASANPFQPRRERGFLVRNDCED
jgi:hypothetical protein